MQKLISYQAPLISVFPDNQIKSHLLAFEKELHFCSYFSPKSFITLLFSIVSSFDHAHPQTARKEPLSQQQSRQVSMNKEDKEQPVQKVFSVFYYGLF